MYAIDPDQDHSECMGLLQDAGIYVIADLGEPETSINRDTPAWNIDIYNRYTKVVDELQKYSNTLGFFAGNEVSNAPNNTIASAFVKAAVRDVKAYIIDKKYRPIGVGYATNDDETRTNLADYFNCGPPEQSIDFWGYNIYSWCGDSDLDKSSYTIRTKEFSTYNVPAFFAEYGCNKVQPRKFTEVAALFGDSLTPVWSGGILYMYFQETNNYGMPPNGLISVQAEISNIDIGLVKIGANKQVTTLADFNVYSTQIAKVTPSGVKSADYKPTNTARACPTLGSSWEAVSQLPPAPNPDICRCMAQNLTCVANSGLDAKSLKAQFDYICDDRQGNNCEGINADAKIGKYGAYSMCDPNDRLSWAFNTYFFDQTTNNPANDDPCNFDGDAKKQNPSSPSSCKAAVSQAGADGNGVITSAPSGTSGAQSTSTKTGAATAITIPNFNFGMLQLAAYVVIAAATGAGMVLL